MSNTVICTFLSIIFNFVGFLCIIDGLIKVLSEKIIPAGWIMTHNGKEILIGIIIIVIGTLFSDVLSKLLAEKIKKLF